MTDAHLSRRNLALAITGALTGALTGLGVARPAAALRSEPFSDWAGRLEASCAAEEAFHLEMLRAAEEELGVELTPSQRTQALEALRCPRCGCRLLADLDLPETGPDPDISSPDLSSPAPLRK